jgi:membrane carboxypeptidase/penicillin-binding protein PbpC
MDGPLKAYQEKIVEVWPPDIATFFRSRGRTDILLPPHNPHCRAILEEKDKGLRMRSPLPGGFYAVTNALAGNAQKIPLMVQSRHSDMKVYWYVDNVLVGQGSPDQVFYIQPMPGLHRASVLDTRGQFDTVDFRVRRMF